MSNVITPTSQPSTFDQTIMMAQKASTKPSTKGRDRAAALPDRSMGGDTGVPSLRNNRSAGFNSNFDPATTQALTQGGWGGTPGMLPTLGLCKYKNVDLQSDKRNPFSAHA